MEHGDHLHAGAHISHRRERRRFILDCILVATFITLVSLLLLGHLESRREEREKESRVALSRAQALDLEQQLIEERRRVSALAMRMQDDAVTDGGVASAESGSAGAISMGVVSTLLDKEPAQSTTTPPTPEEAKYPTYADVTSVRYENTRMGFVLELPLTWGVAYERADEVVFASVARPFAALRDITELPEVLWVRVGRPCTGTEATSTPGIFLSDTVASALTASSCVAPLHITLGYHPLASDRGGREQFLLSVGRTIYPIVSETTPYTPAR